MSSPREKLAVCLLWHKLRLPQRRFMSHAQVLQPDGNWWRFPDADRLTTDGDDDGLELAEADQLSAPEISDDACAAAVQQVPLAKAPWIFLRSQRDMLQLELLLPNYAANGDVASPGTVSTDHRSCLLAGHSSCLQPA